MKCWWCEKEATRQLRVTIDPKEIRFDFIFINPLCDEHVAWYEATNYFLKKGKAVLEPVDEVAIQAQEVFQKSLYKSMEVRP